MRSTTTMALTLVAFGLVPLVAAADPPCGTVEVRLKPGAPDMQMVVWIEDTGGKHVDTAYITRLTGQFGLANRPGTPLLKTDFRWPYGRREMVAPIWAHRRDKHYPRVVMGGVCGNSPQSQCPNGMACDIGLPQCGGIAACDCEDSTIAYHSRVSSYEPFYCSPTGASGLDAMSCASKGTFSKGAYRPFPSEFSLYPPRADLKAYDKNVDSADVLDFAKQNDLVAVSQATPPPGKELDPSILWTPHPPLPEGDYVAWVEVSQESDFNASHAHPNQPDTVPQWDFEGHPFLGQPSVVYKVPFRYSAHGGSAIATQYAGYSTWDGSEGVIHAPDNTITTSAAGSGAGRLLDVSDGIDVYRVKVLIGVCQGPAPGDMGDGGMPDGGIIVPECELPAAPTDLTIGRTATSMTVRFRTPTSGEQPNRYAVRYQEGTAPLDDATFFSANAAPSISGGEPGVEKMVTIDGLMPKTSYAIAVRGISGCNKASATVSQVVMTDEQKFTVLSGCFVATAAYGTEMEASIGALRRLRDGVLLPSPAGQLFVAGYYAFGPSLASVVGHDEHLRAAARAALDPLVHLAERVTSPDR